MPSARDLQVHQLHACCSFRCSLRCSFHALLNLREMATAVRTIAVLYGPAGQHQRAPAWRKTWSRRQHNEQRLRKAWLDTSRARGRSHNKAQGPAELHSVHTAHSQGKPGASTTCNPSPIVRTQSIQNGVQSCAILLLDHRARSQQ